MEESTGTCVEYSYDDIFLSLILPSSWEYEIDEYYDGCYNCGIRFFPKDCPALSLYLSYHTSPIGLCGTGVTIDEITFDSDISATSYIESSGSYYSYILIYDIEDGVYSLDYFTDTEIWESYKSEISSILETVNIGR